MKVAEYISGALADFGARHVFMLTGGGAMFLNDAFGHQGRLHCIFNHHEQACAMAAEAYARIAGKPAIVNVTTGPGGINAMNGVFGAWVNSIPMLVISGQVKRETLVSSYKISGLRQIGDQEADTTNLVKSITKYCALVDDPASIRYQLEKAWYLATAGRPGPCWLDIPIDVQTSQVDPDDLTSYNPVEDEQNYEGNLPEICSHVLHKLAMAERPVILAGKGIRLGNALDEFEQVIRALNIPVVPGWTSIDLIASDDPLFCGRPGDLGTRAGNFTVQNSDVLLVLGNRLGIRQVSYNWDSLRALPIRCKSMSIQRNSINPRSNRIWQSTLMLNRFSPSFSIRSRNLDLTPNRPMAWTRWCKERLARYPAVLPQHRKPKNGRLIHTTL